MRSKNSPIQQSQLCPITCEIKQQVSENISDNFQISENVKKNQLCSPSSASIKITDGSKFKSVNGCLSKESLDKLCENRNHCVLCPIKNPPDIYKSKGALRFHFREKLSLCQ